MTISRDLDVEKVSWPFIVVRSEQGYSRHILEPHPYPNGSWNVVCSNTVRWYVERPVDPPAQLCSKCGERAERQVRHYITRPDERVPDYLYRWTRDVAEFLDGQRAKSGDLLRQFHGATVDDDETE